MAALRCPACPDAALAETAPRPGLSVDSCPVCGGAWLDMGEVYAFTRERLAARDALKAAYARPMPSTRECPRCARPLAAVRLEGPGIIAEACPKCGGNWFDKGEAARFIASLAPAPSAPPAEAAPPAASRPTPEETRPLTDDEARRLAGPDASVFVAAAMGMCGAAALGVLWVMRGSAGGAAAFLTGAVVIGAAVVIAKSLASARSRGLRGAHLVPGSVAAREDRGGVLVDLTVAYEFAGSPRTAKASVPAGGPLDAAVGARSWVAVRPEAPDAGVVVSPL